ncbi:hypothetical protein [Nonomuraea sp. B19D2]|uniref:hypothetical protein n=1 Tax=Nonomuraea sp. B19D2 TaxID=3159561 RepID=UPI0032DA9783
MFGVQPWRTEDVKSQARLTEGSESDADHLAAAAAFLAVRMKSLERLLKPRP